MQELTLRLADSALGRSSVKRAPWQVTYAREIGPEELVLLHSMSMQPTDQKAPLARLRAPHHTLAQFLAEGKEPIEVARITGYEVARIRTLQNDPAFSELVMFYSEQHVHAQNNVQQSIAHVAATATAILQERLEDEPESFSNKDLLALQTAQLDRSGHGPQSKKTVEIHDPKNVLHELRALMSQENRAVIVPRAEPIEIEYSEVLNDEESSQTNPTPVSGVRE